MMRSMTFALASLVGLAACGDDAVVTPDDTERELPARVAPPPAPDLDGGPPPPLDEELDYGDCCDVAFAIRDLAHVDPERTAWARLRGSDAPLDGEGVELTLADGVWGATVCMPLTYAGTYHYELAIADDPEDDTPFVERQTNPNVPHEPSATGGLANRYEPLESCADEAGVHANVSEE